MSMSIALLPEKIRDRVIVTDAGCIEWGGSCHPSGYGQVRWGGQVQRVHRVVYAYSIGAIPDGLDLDHACHTEAVARGECSGGPLCQHRKCVNPDHLEPVASGENTRRGLAGVARGLQLRSLTVCPQGHEYTPENTYVRPDRAARGCRKCRVDATRRYRERKAS